MTELKENHNPHPDEPKSIPDWLKNLQENSWELELLVSGGAVFTLIQLPEYFWNWITALRIQTSLPGFSLFLICGILGIKILTNGFILHLILRAYWLAMVCLNFVFPSGINPKTAKHRFPFKNLHNQGDLKNLIMKVDKVCGLVIFCSISSAILLLCILFAFGILILLMVQLESSSFDFAGEVTGILAAVFFGLGVLYILDLFSLGILRKIKLLSFLVFPFFRLFDFLTFRSFYQRPLVFFGSNVRKGSFFLAAFIFSFVTVLTVYSSVFRKMGWKNPFDFREYRFSMTRQGYSMGHRLYADEADWDDRQIVFIPSKIIRDNVLQVNITYIKGMDDFIRASHPADSMRFLENIAELSVDDTIVENVKWFDRWEKDLSNIGITAMVPLENLPNGLHFLKLKSPDLPYSNFRQIVKEKGREFVIPFWKDVH
jgi:hypothetical protein